MGSCIGFPDDMLFVAVFWQDLNLKLQEEMQHAADASAVGQAGAAETDAAT